MKVMALDAPPEVLIVTDTAVRPTEGGTVTLQEFCVGQFVGAT